MANPVIFKDLPATFPEKDKYQKPSIVSSIVFHVLLVVMIIFLPLMFPQQVEPWITTFLVAPLPPPPAAPPPAPIEVVAAQPAMRKIAVQTAPVSDDALMSPLVIPKDIARIVDEPVAPAGIVGGVPGGVPGGVAGGVLGGFLAANARDLEVAAPPPPPPPPPPAPASVVRGPIRIGGNVQEPKIVKLVPPVYPVLAQKARVSGMVVLEATLTTDGTVDEIKVISGHPLLIKAAIDCVKQWEYEPTYLNGEPVAVILTAKVSFFQKPNTW
jgi:protein TonB